MAAHLSMNLAHSNMFLWMLHGMSYPVVVYWQWYFICHNSRHICVCVWEREKREKERKVATDLCYYATLCLLEGLSTGTLDIAYHLFGSLNFSQQANLLIKRIFVNIGILTFNLPNMQNFQGHKKSCTW